MLTTKFWDFFCLLFDVIKIKNLFRAFLFTLPFKTISSKGLPILGCSENEILMMEEDSSGKMASIFIGTLVIVDCVQDSDRGNIFLQ